MGFVGDMIKVHYQKKWGKDLDGKFYIKENGKYVKGCYGDTEEEALSRYHNKVSPRDENLLPLAIMLSTSVLIIAYVIIEFFVL